MLLVAPSMAVQVGESKGSPELVPVCKPYLDRLQNRRDSKDV
ncbi:hypothetical protein [Arsenophonus sp.]|nr:hypothetical protein [Arsenophonus sp.]MDR5617039.1 hypothetical protein [Arsenophonus sp.]